MDCVWRFDTFVQRQPLGKFGGGGRLPAKEQVQSESRELRREDNSRLPRRMLRLDFSLNDRGQSPILALQYLDCIHCLICPMDIP